MWLAVVLALALLLVLAAISCLGCAFTDEANAGKVEAAIAANEVSASLADFRKTIETVAESVEGDQNVGAFSGGAPYLLATLFAMIALVKHIVKRRTDEVTRVVMEAIEAAGSVHVKRVVRDKAFNAGLSRRVARLKRRFVG